ncbi:Glycosyl transferase 2 family protein [Clostridium bornimense]|uniref:Glycosyl transferase 2 family protein n=1 Tax=Clostridium bornimense TaxID=1216932 RepID=W6RXZ7_9CLOT|nr:glycosyltransferase family 2 protein [Clostridium bornimense]CDM69531.1 Glycosyl transferase 2 family protein [Clostridium bornimense]
MKISVIIPNYNGEKIIDGCIQSLLKQDYKDFNIIVVDNNSTDESVKIIEERYPSITLIKNNKNLGFAAAVNIGIKASKSDFVALLNNDTEVDKKWLGNLYSVVSKDNKIFSASSKMVRFYERDIIDDAGDQYNLLGWAYKRGDGSKIDKFNKNKVVFSTCAGAGLYRKNIFEEIGYFDENFFAYLEDIDVSFRGNIHGYKNVYVNDAIVYHMVSATSGSKHNKFKVKLASRNNIYLIRKNMPLIFTIINLPFLILGIIVKYIFFLRKSLGKEYIEGIMEGVFTKNKVEKTKFKFKNLIYYFIIEARLIANTFKMFFKV